MRPIFFGLLVYCNHKELWQMVEIKKKAVHHCNVPEKNDTWFETLFMRNTLPVLSRTTICCWCNHKCLTTNWTLTLLYSWSSWCSLFLYCFLKNLWGQKQNIFLYSDFNYTDRLCSSAGCIWFCMWNSEQKHTTFLLEKDSEYDLILFLLFQSFALRLLRRMSCMVWT